MLDIYTSCSYLDTSLGKETAYFCTLVKKDKLYLSSCEGCFLYDIHKRQQNKTRVNAQSDIIKGLRERPMRP